MAQFSYFVLRGNRSRSAYCIMKMSIPYFHSNFLQADIVLNINNNIHISYRSIYYIYYIPKKLTLLGRYLGSLGPVLSYSIPYCCVGEGTHSKLLLHTDTAAEA